MSGSLGNGKVPRARGRKGKVPAIITGIAEACQTVLLAEVIGAAFFSLWFFGHIGLFDPFHDTKTVNTVLAWWWFLAFPIIFAVAVSRKP
jgi:hypothetical protein